MNRTLRSTRIPSTREAAEEDDPRFMKRVIVRLATAVLVSGGLGLAGLGLGAGTAQADTGVPHQWCPGDSDSTAPTPAYNWDWNVCHTYYWTKTGQGNVPYRGDLRYSNLWDGDNPPDNSYPGCGTDLFTGIPGRC
jgi:hypothetical protein